MLFYGWLHSYRHSCMWINHFRQPPHQCHSSRGSSKKHNLAWLFGLVTLLSEGFWLLLSEDKQLLSESTWKRENNCWRSIQNFCYLHNGSLVIAVAWLFVLCHQDNELTAGKSTCKHQDPRLPILAVGTQKLSLVKPTRLLIIYGFSAFKYCRNFWIICIIFWLGIEI